MRSSLETARMGGFQHGFQKGSPQTEAVKTPVVLFALNGRERRLFFENERMEFAGAEVAWTEEGVLGDESAWRECLAARKPSVLISGWSTPPLPGEWLDRPGCPLRYIGHVTGSVRQVVSRRFLERGGVVTNWGDIAAPDVAEHALLLALAALRNLAAWGPSLKAREEDGINVVDYIVPRTLHGRRVGLHGFGRIARALVGLLRPFGVRIAVFSEGVPASVFRQAGVSPCGSLLELFEGSEVLFECEALTPRTQGSVGEAEFAALPDGAVFVNVGRGRVIDEAAMIAATASGRVRIALDVVAEEPLRWDAALRRLPGAILSPHIGGPTPEHYRVAGKVAARNVEAFLAGRPLENELTPDAYDRST